MRDDPKSARQCAYVAILCMKLGIKDPLEEKQMTDGEIGVLIRDLEWQVRLNRIVHSGYRHGKGVG